MVSEQNSISSMAPSSSSSSSSSTVFPSSFNISHHFRTPMDRSSYLCWRSQFLDILEIHDFLDLVDSSTSTPPKLLPDSTSNPVYLPWVRSDKLVLSWIKATVSSSIQTLLLPCKTSSEAWALLDKRLSPLSKIHVRTLRDQLRSLKKDPDQSVADFLLHAKLISDSLGSAGAPISESDLVDSIMDGLGSSYKEFITSIHLRPQVSFDEFYDLLLQEESLQHKLTAASQSTVVALSAFQTGSSQPAAAVASTTSDRPPSSSSSRGRGSACDRGRGREQWTSPPLSWSHSWGSSPSSQWSAPPVDH